MRRHYLAFTASRAAEPKRTTEAIIAGALHQPTALTTTAQLNIPNQKAHKVFQGPLTSADVRTNWTELVDKMGSIV